MWCFVIEPSGTIHELILPQGSLGSECLDMIAQQINLVEKDYFGLQYTNASGTEKWLNLRNKLSDQLTGRSPHRVKLVVKFFVKIQELQQQITRDLFYATIIQHIESKKIDISNIHIDDYTKLVSLKAQISTGDFNADAVPDYRFLLPSSFEWTQEIQQKVETEHLSLSSLSTSEAKVEFVKIVSDFPDYGIETFNVKSQCNENDMLSLNVCQGGLKVSKIDDHDSTVSGKAKHLINFIPYDEISTVSYKGKRFTIVHGSDKASHVHSSFILKKSSEAVKLFRTFTEYHSFFQCNSVKKSVVEKYTRTSFGRVLAVFNSNTEKGKKYLFDVLLTRRQAYDRAWSILNAPDKKRQSAFYHSERNYNRKSVYSLSKIDESLSESYPTYLPKRRTINFDIQQNLEKDNIHENINNVKDLSVEELRETVSNLLENKTCQVCMDAEVSIAFCPCGHIACCVDCASLCRECPICRAQITYAQRVFFSLT